MPTVKINQNYMNIVAIRNNINLELKHMKENGCKTAE